jgi:hypothetical protein
MRRAVPRPVRAAPKPACARGYLGSNSGSKGAGPLCEGTTTHWARQLRAHYGLIDTPILVRLGGPGGGGRMSTGWSSSGANEPPRATESLRRSRHSRPPWYARHVAPWAAAGLIVIGGLSAFVMMHRSPAAHPRAQAAICGLVSCAVVSTAASPSRRPAVPSTPNSLPPPKASSRAPAPVAPEPTPSPAPSPAPSPRSKHHRRQRPLPTPTEPWRPSPTDSSPPDDQQHNAWLP